MFRALALDKQKLTGLLGLRVRANSEGFLENIDPQVLLRTLLPSTSGGNQSSSSGSPERLFPGQFLNAAADAFEYNHDLQLRAQMDKVAAALTSFAQTARPPSNLPVTLSELHGRRVHLLGMLAYFRVTNDSAAYVTAQAMAASLTKPLKLDQNGGALAVQSAKLAQLGLIEPLAQLYRLSGDRKYLDVCIGLAQSIPFTEVTSSDPAALLEDKFNALAGLADLYELTADTSYLNITTSSWKHILSTNISVTGAPLTGDGTRQETDACSAAAWLQFTFRMLRVTGDAIYGDQLERSIYNEILAAQNGRNGEISSELEMNGEKSFAGKLQGSSGVCLLCEAKALALLPQAVWGRYDNGIAINLYNSGRAFFTLKKHGLVQIYSESTFPQSGKLQLHVEPSVKSAQFPLRLRVPSWTQEFTVDIADIHLKARAGEVVVLDREWKSGDTVRVSIGLTVRALPLGNSQAGEFVLQRGPQILVLSKALNPNLDDWTAASLKADGAGRYRLLDRADKLPRDFGGEQAYGIAGKVHGSPQDLLLVPFADAVDYRSSLR